MRAVPELGTRRGVFGVRRGQQDFRADPGAVRIGGARLRHWLVFAGKVATLYAPFALHEATDLVSLLVFAREWEFNAAAFGLLTTLVPAFEAKLVLKAVSGRFWGMVLPAVTRNALGGMPCGEWLYGAFRAVSPVVNSWYPLWLLPFAAIFPGAWAWTAATAVLLSYVTGLNLNVFDLHALSIAGVGPFAGVRPDFAGAGVVGGVWPDVAPAPVSTPFHRLRDRLDGWCLRLSKGWNRRGDRLG